MTAGPFSLDGTVALVTGASSGLGRHFARTLAAAGAKVAVCARRRDALGVLADEIEAAGGTSRAVVLDVTEAESVRAAFDAAETAFGTVTLLVNNAGLAIDKPFADTTEAEWDAVLDTNLKGAWLMSQEAAKRMIAAGTGGAIVNVTSILDRTATPRVHGYAASKAGLSQLTRTLAVELARHGIRVNALAPGYVETDINRDLLAGPAGGRLVRRVPLRRFAQPADLDGALLLLASAAGAYMTGEVVVVDGGMSLSAL